MTSPLAAQLACMPVIAAISGTVSLAAVPANLLALPVVAFTTVLGLAAAIVSLASPGVAGALCTIAGGGCHWLVFAARTALTCRWRPSPRPRDRSDSRVWLW